MERAGQVAARSASQRRGVAKGDHGASAFAWPHLESRGSLANMKSKPTPGKGWTAQQDLVITIASPEVAAEKLGLSVELVLARRLELGLPDPLSIQERRKRPRA